MTRARPRRERTPTSTSSAAGTTVPRRMPTRSTPPTWARDGWHCPTMPTAADLRGVTSGLDPLSVPNEGCNCIYAVGGSNGATGTNRVDVFDPDLAGLDVC